MIRRGDVIRVNLDPVVGHEIGRTRPAVVIQNDIGNRFAPTTIVAPITAWNPKKAQYPFCVEVPTEQSGLPKRSLANLAQLRTIDRSRLVPPPLGHLAPDTMAALDEALALSVGLMNLR